MRGTASLPSPKISAPLLFSAGTLSLGCVAKLLIGHSVESEPVPITPDDPFHWRHYEGEVILCCVGWYLDFPLSYRNVAKLIGERGLLTHYSCVFPYGQITRSCFEHSGFSARGQFYYWRFSSPKNLLVEQFVNVPERSGMPANSIQAYSHPRSTFISERLESHTLGII
jgi:hypothetical protein